MKVPPWIEMPRSAQAGGAPNARDIFLAKFFRPTVETAFTGRTILGGRVAFLTTEVFFAHTSCF
jgi:hypothetical protein